MLAGKATLNDEEATAFEASENTRLNRDLFDPIKGQPSAGYAPRAQGGVLSYNEFWYERGSKLTKDKRTSLIFDPPSGTIPFTDAARRSVAEMTPAVQLRPWRLIRGPAACRPLPAGLQLRSADDPWRLQQQRADPAVTREWSSSSTRWCTTRASSRPTAVRTRKLRQWSGDSRGHWEGDTLVVETINFRRETSLQGSTADTRLVERFTRVDADTIKYEFTVSDREFLHAAVERDGAPRENPRSPLRYGCHEGNYALPNILAGARAQEKQKAD